MPAITSSLNKSLVLNGVTAATVSALRGDLIFESEIPFRLKSLRSAPGVLTQQVIRANGSGLLTFAYKIGLTETDYDAELRLAVGFSLSGLAVTFADFRVDGSGITPPNYFDSSPIEGYGFKFNYGIAAGRDSRFCFIATNAREYWQNRGEVKLITGQRSVVLDVVAPLSTAPTRWTEVKSQEAPGPAVQQGETAPAEVSGELSPTNTAEPVI